MNTDRVTAIACLVISGLFIYGAHDFPYLGAVFPMVIASVLALMSLILLIKSFLNPEISDWIKNIYFKNVFLVSASIIIYVIFIPILGIVTTSSIYIIVFSLSASQRIDFRLVVFSSLVAVGISGLFSYIFIKQFYVPLPTGWLF